MKRVFAVVGMVGGFLVASAAPAFAHAVLITTDPAASATLTTGPKAVTLRFAENVEASLGAVRVFDQRAQRVDVGAPVHPNAQGSAVAASLPSLRSGLYVVTWRVISADSHPVHGAFTFRVGASPAPTSLNATNSLVSRLLTRQQGTTSVGVVYGAVRAGVFAALAVLIGGAMFVALNWPQGRTSRRAARIVWGGWWALLASTLAAYGIQGAYAAGLPLTSALQGAELRGIWHTRFGHVSGLRLGLLIPAFGLLWLLLPGRRRLRPLAPWWYAGAGVVGAGLALTPGLAGHANTGRWHELSLVTDVVHVAAMAGWLGGLLVLCACVLTIPDPRLLRHVLRRFSVVGFTSVALLVATGVFQSYRQVGSIHALTSTSYGRILLIKTWAVVALVAAAATSRDVVNRWSRRPLEPDTADVQTPVLAGVATQSGPGLTDHRCGAGSRRSDESDGEGVSVDVSVEEKLDVTRLRRSVVTEVAVAVAILFITALLVNAGPPVALESTPFFKTVPASGHLYDLNVSPAKSGPNQVHVTTLTRSGAPASVLAMTVTFDNPSRGIPPINVPLLRLAPGHYASYAFQFPFGGTWRMSVTARFSDIDETTFNTPVKVR